MMTTGVFRLGADVKHIPTQSGTEFGSLALAASYYNPATKNTESKGRETQWLHCSLGSQALERMGEYLVKGTLVEASIADVHIREYTKNDGTPGTSLDGRVVTINFAGGKNEGGQAQAAAPAQAKAAAPAARAARAAKAAPAPADEDFPEDVPF